MKKIYPYLATIPIVVFALFPPTVVRIPMAPPATWMWMAMAAGFLGFCALYTKALVVTRLAIAYLFISCFFSKGPAVSFNAYIPIAVMAWYYIMCTKVTDWTPLIKSLKVIILLNLILLFLQRIGHEPLFNFGFEKTLLFGSVGNPMQLKSFLIIATAILIGLTKPKILKNKIVLMCAIVLTFVLLLDYAIYHKALKHFLYARGPVWLKTMQLTLRRPFFGWGLGQFKIVFPALASGHFTAEGAWMSPHNCWLQIGFEAGMIGLGLIAGLYLYLLKLIRRIDPFLFFALLIIGLDMSVHFPTRQPQCIFMILAFVAHCARKVKESIWLFQK